MSHASLPFHFYVKVRNKFLGPSMPDGTTLGIWHGVYSRPGQILMCHVMLESGAHWTGLPIHAISTQDSFSYSEGQLMPWAAMGDDLEIFHSKYLEGLECAVFRPIQVPGRHTGVLVDWSDGYSRYPAEHKPLNLIELSNGQFALVPNNFVLFKDKHFIDESARENLKHYRRGETVYWEK